MNANHDCSVTTTQVLKDPYLLSFYALAYSQLRAKVHDSHLGRTIEVGSGRGLAAHFGHNWLMSDVVADNELDVVNLAESLPIRSESLDAIILKDTWHHIPNIEQFLEEAHRVLRVGGLIAVFDPYWSPLAQFVYRFLHQERWDKKTTTWRFESSSPWDSNQALSFLMLKRDRQTFDRNWGLRFAVSKSEPLVGPSYLLSGGVSRRTRVSGRLLVRMLAWERRQGAWFNSCRLFHIFTLVKI